MAIIAVAAHLAKVPLGEDYGLRRLSERYGHDLSALDQVCGGAGPEGAVGLRREGKPEGEASALRVCPYV